MGLKISQHKNTFFLETNMFRKQIKLYSININFGVPDVFDEI